MLRSMHAIAIFCFASALPGCQSETPAMYMYSVSPTNPMKPLTQDFGLFEGTNKCSKFADCELSTVFPETALTPSPETGCESISVVSMGPALRPAGVSVDQGAKVWVALITPAQMGRAKAARVVGSTDSRFDEAAYKVARSYVFKPKQCAGVGYEEYVIAPVFFGPASR